MSLNVDKGGKRKKRGGKGRHKKFHEEKKWKTKDDKGEDYQDYKE